MRANLTEIKNAMNHMQSKLDALTGRVNEAEEQISELEDGVIEKKENTETWPKKIQSQDCRLREITDSMKHSNVRIIGIPKAGGRKREVYKRYLNKL